MGFTNHFGNCRKFSYLTPIPSVVEQTIRSIWNGVQEVKGPEGKQTKENQERSSNLVDQYNNTITKTLTCLVTAVPKKSSTMRHHSISIQPSLWARRSRKMKRGARCFTNRSLSAGRARARAAQPGRRKGETICVHHGRVVPKGGKCSVF